MWTANVITRASPVRRPCYSDSKGEIAWKTVRGCTYTLEKNEAIAATNTWPGFVQNGLDAGRVCGVVVIDADIVKERLPNVLVERGLKFQSFVVKGVSPSLKAAAGVAQVCGCHGWGIVFGQVDDARLLPHSLTPSLPHFSATTSALNHLIIP